MKSLFRGLKKYFGKNLRHINNFVRYFNHKKLSGHNYLKPSPFKENEKWNNKKWFSL